MILAHAHLKFQQAWNGFFFFRFSMSWQQFLNALLSLYTLSFRDNNALRYGKASVFFINLAGVFYLRRELFFGY